MPQQNPPSLSKIDVVGDRPAGSIPTSHDLVQAALAALEQTGVKGTLEKWQYRC